MDKQRLPPAKFSTPSRVRRSHLDARTAYNRLSVWYDLFAGSERKLTRLALDLLAVQPGERVLDLGCGTGSALATLAQTAGQKGCLTGCDLSAGMLAKAQRKIKRLDENSTVSLIAADAAKLPIQTNSFDALLLSFTLELFDTPEIPLILAECRRVLTSGGRLAIVSLAKTPAPGWMERTYEWFHEHYERFADCRPIFLAECVSESGFLIVKDYREVMWGLPIEILLCTRD